MITLSKTVDIDLTSDSLAKKIILFTIPIILSNILQLLFNACDLMVIGRFSGDDSLAAVGSTSSLINLIVNLFIGVSIGANVVVANAVGQRNKTKAFNAVHTAILFSIISGIILTFFGIFTARLWLELLDTTGEVIDKATLYLQIYFGGIIFNLIYNYGSSILRAVGETKKPLLYMLISGIVNLLLNLLTVIVFRLDVAGVAISTVISEGISAALVIICLCKRNGYAHLELKKIRINLKSLKEMIIIGLPAGIQAILFSISNVFIQKAVNSFKSTAIVSGNTAAANLEGFVYDGMNGFYQACITFTGQNYGAKKLKNCKKSLLYCLMYATLAGVILGGGMLLFGKILLKLYTKTNESLDYGMTRLIIICSTYYLCGIMDVMVGGLRGLGYSIAPMIVSIMGACVFRLVWIYTIFKAYHTLNILYISYPISWFITGLIHIICYIIIYNKIKKKNFNIIEGQF